MSSMLSTGVSGLMAFQTALNTTSHNISNSTTEGYSRQSVSLATNTAQYMGSGWVGTGVSVTGITRTYNDLVAAQVRASSSSMNQWDAYSSMASSVDNLFGDSSTGLSSTLQSFFDAFQDVANAPTSNSARQVLLSQAQALTDQLQSFGSSLDDLSSQVNSQLKTEAQTVNSLAQNIAALNAQITAATARGDAPPNDMLDQRDSLLDELSTHVSISTVKQDDGAVNVFIGNGLSLVVGSTASTVGTTSNEYDVSQTELTLKAGNGYAVNITDTLSGGTIGGLLSFRDEVLTPAQNALGLTAVTLASLVNQQQNAGMDLYGDLGSDMFSVGDPSAAASRSNTGTADLSVTRSDYTALTGSNYVMSYTASGWVLQDADSGKTVTMTGSGTAADPFVADGLSIEVSGTASVGDSFLIKPTSTAVGSMSVVLTDPSGVAAAAPIVASADSSNTGNASITQGVVTDASDANLRNTTTIEFLSATTYTLDGGATVQTYTSGSPISANGWQVTITGTPAAGDTFTVADNSDGTGDNRNALLLGNLLNADSLSGGSSSLNDIVSNWVSDIGVKTNQAQNNLSAQTTLYEDNLNTQQSISGVNTDEEAANLIRYQQAYAAAAQVISISNKLFDTLIQAVS